MESVNFYPKTLSEIPEQDNPATYGDECLLIVKDEKCSHAVVWECGDKNQEHGENIGFVAKFQSEDLAVEYGGFKA